jgi:hypothetical protein
MGSVLKNCMITNACFMPLKPVKKEAGNFDGNRGLMSGIGILLGFLTKGKMVRSGFGWNSGCTGM